MSRVLSFAMFTVLFFSCCPEIFADQIVLKNGDRLTGKILKKDGETIVIETEFAGVVTISWPAVEKIISDQPLNIKLHDGKEVKGKVAAEDEKVEVETESGSKVPIEKAQIETVRNEEQQRLFEAAMRRLQNPGFFQRWVGNIDVGFNLVTGNSKTRNFTLSSRAVRTTPRDRISLYANATRTRETIRGVDITTASTVLAGGRYDRNITPRIFAFGSVDLEHDGPAFLNLRTVLGGGIGYRLITTDAIQLDVLGGADYDHEFFRFGFRRRSAEILIGDDFRYRLNSRIQFTQRLRLHPNLEDSGRLRTNLQASMVTSLNRWLGWHISFTHRFDNRPFRSAETIDTFLSTGLRLNFGNRR